MYLHPAWLLCWSLDSGKHRKIRPSEGQKALEVRGRTWQVLLWKA